MSDEIVRFEKTSKVFPGVVALNRVDFSLKKGEIHALVGKNGAGKTTLVSILSGVYPPDGGSIYHDGQIVERQDLRKLKVSTVFQEGALFPNMTIAENIAARTLDVGSTFGLVSHRKEIEKATELLDLFGLEFDGRTALARLSPAEQKVIEILRALATDCEILILDEPTATLTIKETNRLFELLNGVKNTRVGIIYISHRLEEIFRIADRVSVLKDGEMQGTLVRDEFSMDTMIGMMTGGFAVEAANGAGETRSILNAAPVLETRGLSHGRRRFRDVSLVLRAGEILGIAGLVGAGKTEFARTLVGIEKAEKGEVLMNGQPLNARNVGSAKKKGIAYVTESRKDDGLFLRMSIKDNIVSPALDTVSTTFGLVNDSEAEKVANRAVQRFRIKAGNVKQRVNVLSGGNQQKVLLSMWLNLSPAVLIIDEPTVGVDVQAKEEIYQIVREVAKRGTGVIILSSEIKELMQNAHRIMTIYNGTITGTRLSSETTEDEILHLISGVENTDRPESRAGSENQV